MEIVISIDIIKADVEISSRLIMVIRRLRDVFLDFSEIVAILRRAAIEVDINYFRGAEIIFIL